MFMSTTTTIDGLSGLVGTELGVSEWLEVTQKRVDTFADATDDHQWIHVDPVRAAAGPFGAPIAHGYLTLSLLVPLISDVLTVTDASLTVNYGLEKVRFPAPVPVGSRIRLRAVLSAADPASGGIQATVQCTVEIDGGSKPACVAQIVFRYLR
jgi:acyl dehydratase